MDAQKNKTNWLQATVLLIVVMAGALAMSPSVADPDLWGHVQFGRDVIREGWFPETNPYSYNAEGFRWINHENLSEIVMAWTVDHLGPLGLVFGKFLLSLFVITAILISNARRGVGMIANSVIVLLVAWNLGYHWSFRPQLSSFVGFTLLVMLLNWSFFHWRDRWHLPIPGTRWFSRGTADRHQWEAKDLNYSNFHSRFLWLAPFLFFVWANSHGGFVAGLCIFAAYLGCRTLEAFGRRGSLGWGLARRMTLMLVVAVLGTLLNPYSYHLISWLFESLGQPRPEISDWSSDQLFSLIGLKFWALIAVSIVAMVGSRKSWDFTHTVILILTLWQAVSHFRHVPFFAIACGFWVGPHLQSMLARFRSADATDPILDTRRGQWGAAAVSLIVVLAVGVQLSSRMSQLNVDRSQYPVDAFQFMHDQELSGKMVVTYDWAQYMIGTFCTEEKDLQGSPSRVAFDGRFRTCYPQVLVDLHFDWLFGEGHYVSRSRSSESPDCDPHRILRLNQPNLVVNRRRGERTETHMNAATQDWVLLYQDRIAQVWGLRAIYDDPKSERYLAPDARQISDRDVQGYVAWPAFPRDRERILAASN